MIYIYVTLIIFLMLYSRWVIEVYQENRVRPFDSYGWYGVVLCSWIYAILYGVFSLFIAIILISIYELVGEYLW
jgi:hypothetical protein